MASNKTTNLNLNTWQDGDYVELNEFNANFGMIDNKFGTVDSKVSNNTAAIASLASGSPKGVYATQAALQTAFPTGTTGTYVVTADGKLYAWIDSAWTAIVQYQSTGIADGSVKENSLDPTFLNEKIKSGVYWRDGNFLDYEPASYATTTTGETNYRMINKPLGGGVITSITIDTTSTVVGLAFFRKNGNGSFSLVSNTSVQTTSGLHSYNVNIALNEEGLYLALAGLIKYQQFTGTIPANAYQFYDSVTLGQNVTPTLNSMQMNFRLTVSGTIKSKNAIQLANDLNTPTAGQRAAFDVSWGEEVITDFINPSSSLQSNTGYKIPNKTYTAGLITRLDINAFGTRPFSIAVIKKIDATQYQIKSIDVIAVSTGLHSYDVSIELTEDGLYLGFDGDFYYETGAQDAVKYQLLQAGSYSGVGAMFTPTLNTAYFALHTRAVLSKPSTNALEIDSKFKDMLARINSESTRLDGRIDSMTGTPSLGGTMLVIGDSISINTSHTTTFYHTILAAKYGFNVVNKAIDATGWLAAQTNGVAGAGVSLKGRLVSGAFDGLTFDFLTIFYGTNDWGVTDSLGTSGSAILGSITDSINTISIYGGIKFCLETLISKYPTKGIGVISPIQRSNGANTANGKGVTMKQIITAIKECCELYSVPFIDLFNQTRLRPTNAANSALYFTDGLHMNIKGHQTIARQLDSWIATL